MASINHNKRFRDHAQKAWYNSNKQENMRYLSIHNKANIYEQIKIKEK